MRGRAGEWLAALGRGLREFYIAPYRQMFARSAREEEDLFMLLACSESLGIPNPTSVYTNELLPVIHDRYHEWHLRMGEPHSPLDHIRCC